jgi:hypothetical protein
MIKAILIGVPRCAMIRIKLSAAAVENCDRQNVHFPSRHLWQALARGQLNDGAKSRSGSTDRIMISQSRRCRGRGPLRFSDLAGMFAG